MSGKWNSGPPPSCGWWPARVSKILIRFHTTGLYGWWNGVHWSPFVTSDVSTKTAAQRARLKGAFDVSDIEWQDRPKSWPARSKT